MLAVISNAAEYQLTTSGAGSGNGSNLSNAMSVSTHNSGTFSPGDTIVINGTVSEQIIPPSSGTSGNPITYLFAAGAKMSKGVWPTGQGAIQLGTKSWIIIDGGATGTIGGRNATGTVNGIIECTSNGVGLATQNTCGGVVGTGASNCIVKSLKIGPLFLRTGTTDQNQPGAGVENLASSAEITNFRVTNCVIHDSFFGINLEGGDASSGFQIDTNEIYNCNHAISLATRNSSSNNITGSTIYNNWMHAWTIWNDTTVANSHHHNGVFLKADSGVIDGVDIYGNKFGPGYGGSYQTAAIYGNTGMKNIRAYNNLFLAGTGEYSSNAMITLESTRATTISIYNNTFLNDAGISISCSGSNGLVPGLNAAQTWNVKNNLGATSGGYGFIQVHYSPGITLNCDYNIGYGYNYSANPYDFSSDGTGNTMTFAAWQALGYDTNGSTSNPSVNTNGTLTIARPGADLSSLFTIDYTGATRSAPFDIGAFEYGAALGASLTATTATAATINFTP